MNQMKVILPRRRSRRTTKSRTGSRPDLRRTVRTTMRTHGEPSELFWRQRRLRCARSSSTCRARWPSTRAISSSSPTRRGERPRGLRCSASGRLTRITRALERQRPDDALDEAARSVFDWEGGTRIGHAIDTFVRQWGRRGMSRGAIVVICSDGLDRGDLAVLAAAMERLSRLSQGGVDESPQGLRSGFQADDSGHDGGRSSHRPDPVRPRSGQPRRAGRATAGAEVSH